MKTFKLAAVVVAMIAATNISAQENTGASVEYDFTAVTETGDTATIDMSYIDLADAFGGKPYDVKFKDGEPKATVITGWSVGVKGGINSYMGAQYGAFVQNYFGWGHIALNAEISENMEIDKDQNQKFRSLGASVDFAITLAHFPSVKDGSSVKYGAVIGLEKRFFGSITKVSLEGRCESYSFKSYGKSYQPVYGSVTVKIEFGLGRRPNKGRF